MAKKALITGITGQDGSFLAEFLLEKGYEVHGIVRRASISNTARIDHLIAKNAITLHEGDLSDSSSIILSSISIAVFENVIERSLKVIKGFSLALTNSNVSKYPMFII